MSTCMFILTGSMKFQKENKEKKKLNKIKLHWLDYLLSTEITLTLDCLSVTLMHSIYILNITWCYVSYINNNKNVQKCVTNLLHWLCFICNVIRMSTTIATMIVTTICWLDVIVEFTTYCSDCLICQLYVGWVFSSASIFFLSLLLQFINSILLTDYFMLKVSFSFIIMCDWGINYFVI